ncbi:MAG TPA: hypothetical protein VLV81_00740 [Acidimicrobiia bacterium]|nr:hypothetical protein [Acidimicrobiia bacterium]
MTDRGLTDGSERWTLEFARPDGTGGFARLSGNGERSSYWAALVSPSWGTVVVHYHGLAAPRHPRLLAVRGDGLWAELVEETAAEHWSAGLEAFGLRLDDPLDAEGDGRGERLPVGFDLEWEVGRGTGGVVHGDLLVARDRVEFEGVGRFAREVIVPDPGSESRRVSWRRGPDDGDSASGEAVGVVDDARGLPVAVHVGGRAFSVSAVVVQPPVGPPAAGRLVRALVVGEAGCGWLERDQPGAVRRGASREDRMR